MLHVNMCPVPVNDTHLILDVVPKVINVKGTYVKYGKISLPNHVDTTQLVFR